MNINKIFKRMATQYILECDKKFQCIFSLPVTAEPFAHSGLRWRNLYKTYLKFCADRTIRNRYVASDMFVCVS